MTALRCSASITPVVTVTRSTPSRARTWVSTSWLIWVRRGHPAMVRATSTATVPGSGKRTAVTMPSSTMSAPSSGSTTDRSTSRTWSSETSGAPSGGSSIGATQEFYRWSPPGDPDGVPLRPGGGYAFCQRSRQPSGLRSTGYDSKPAGGTSVSTTMQTVSIGKKPNPVTLTDVAAAKVAELLAQEDADDLALRVAVRPGGCSGFSYEMFFDADVAEDDVVREFGTVKVVVDSASADLLKGSTLDFSDGLQGAGFHVTNPNATRTCGCGSSFS